MVLERRRKGSGLKGVCGWQIELNWPSQAHKPAYKQRVRAHFFCFTCFTGRFKAHSQPSPVELDAESSTRPCTPFLKATSFNFRLSSIASHYTYHLVANRASRNSAIILAVRPIIARAQLLRLDRVITRALVPLANIRDARGASILDRSGIAIVRVNPGQCPPVHGDNPSGNKMPGVLGAAVPAAAVKLPEILNIEIGDADGTAAIVLDHFIAGFARTTADDVGGAGGLADRDRILADVFPPDVLESAGAWDHQLTARRNFRGMCLYQGSGHLRSARSR